MIFSRRVSISRNIRLTTKGDIKVDPNAVADVISAQVLQHIVRRTKKGIDIYDSPFAPYSSGYKRALVRMNEDPSKVDLWLTGGMLNAVKELSRKITRTKTIIRFGPGTGTSAQVRPPREDELAFTKKGKPKKGKGYRSITTGGRSPPHNVLGGWLHFGRNGRGARPWLGISPSGWKPILRALNRAGIFVGK